MSRIRQVLASLSDAEKTALLHRLLNGVHLPRRADGTIDRAAPWIWQGDTDRDGYGRTSIKGAKITVHRLMYWLLHGQLPPVVRHAAPIPSDVNPYRLNGGGSTFAEGQKLNARDRERDGNTPRGTRNGRSKLTPQKVRDIREAMAQGDRQAEVARRHGVHPTTVRDIASGKIWSHVN